jgi:hypothetical protein
MGPEGVFGIVVGLVVGALYLERRMAKKKVFISYDHSEDANYRRLLQAWDANTSFSFEFDDRSPTVAIDSQDAGRIKAALTTKMQSADYLLVIVGKKSHTSKWMTWEIDKAKQPGIRLRLAAVKIDRDNMTPPGLLGVNTAWAFSFTQKGILDALSKATNSY